MNRTLKRPMFRIGGSAGTGITSGLDQPRKQYADGTEYNLNEYEKERRMLEEMMRKEQLRKEMELDLQKKKVREQRNIAADGGRIGYQQGSMPSFQASGLPGFLTGFGLNLLATPPAGNIFQTSAIAAKEPFNQLQASQARQRQLQAEKDFIRSERLEGQEFETEQLEKRLDVERQKIGAGDKITVQQLAGEYLDDYQGDLNKATNKAKYYLEVRPALASEATGVGETQIGGLIEVDLTNESQAKSFAKRNRNKIGKVFYDINTGTLKKLVKDPETKALGFVDYVLGSGTGSDTEGEILSEANENEFKPKQDIKDVFQPGLTETDQEILRQIEENKKKIEEGMEEIPNYNIYR